MEGACKIGEGIERSGENRVAGSIDDLLEGDKLILRRRASLIVERIESIALWQCSHRFKKGMRAKIRIAETLAQQVTILQLKSVLGCRRSVAGIPPGAPTAILITQGATGFNA